MTRARKALHLLRSDYKYNYPLGADYLVYIQEKKMTDPDLFKDAFPQTKDPNIIKDIKFNLTNSLQKTISRSSKESLLNTL